MGAPCGPRIPKPPKKPEWFSLKNYKSVQKLDFRGWLYQIGMRLELESLWQVYKDPEMGIWEEPIPEFAESWVLRAWGNITEHGIHPVPEKTEDWIFDLHEFHHTSQADYAPIHMLSNQEAYGILFHSHKRREIEKRLEEMGGLVPCSRTVPLEEQDWAVQTYQVGLPSAVLVSLDISLSDKQLMCEFAEWLIYAREELATAQRKKVVTLKDLERWTDEKVLPYWDLQFWAERNRHVYTLDDLDILLFPSSQRHGQDCMRKVVRENYNRASQCYPDLRVQVMRDLGIKRRS
jgi:hypothetical protein